MTYFLPKEEVSVVHDDDLENFLNSLGIFQKYQQGEIKCKFCKTSITFENLHSIFPQSGTIKIVCDNLDCIRELSSLLREGTINL